MENEKFTVPENSLEGGDELSVKSNPIPEPPKINTQHFGANRISEYYVHPFTRHFNGCGQSAMATILTYWNYMQYSPKNAENLYANTNSKPDIFGGLLGTSWERFKHVMESYGMLAYGQNEARLTTNSAIGKLETLSTWVNAGYPVAVILGNGELGRGRGAHWGVVTRITQYEALLANYGVDGYTVSLHDFMKAWQSYGLPGVHYAAVLAHPR